MSRQLPYIAWKKLSHDDFMFVFEDYTLRVEMMDKNCWWWDVSFKGRQVDNSIKMAKTLVEAITHCIMLFANHYFNDTQLPETN